MSIDTKQILEKALSLPAIDRVAILESLLLSLEHPDASIDRSWANEAEKRLAAFNAGRIKAVPADEVFQSTRAPYAWIAHRDSRSSAA